MYDRNEQVIDDYEPLIRFLVLVFGNSRVLRNFAIFMEILWNFGSKRSLVVCSTALHSIAFS